LDDNRLGKQLALR